MKTIQLKKETEKLIINHNQIETELKTIELLKVALNSPVQGGYSIADITIRVRLLDSVEMAERDNASELKLEDASFAALAKIVKETKWSVVSRFILDFVNEFDKN